MTFKGLYCIFLQGQKYNIHQPENVAIAKALQLEGRLTSRRSCWVVYGGFSTAHHAHKLLLYSSDQHFNVVIRFIDISWK